MVAEKHSPKKGKASKVGAQGKSKKAAPQAKAKEASAVIMLEPTADINYAQTLKMNLLEASSASKITLDFNEVTRITTPCMQLLVVFFRFCKQQGKHLELKNISQDAMNSMTIIGLDKHELFQLIK